MKKLISLTAVIAAFGFVSSANAASPPPVYTWTGYYVGLNLGYGKGDDPFSMSTVSGAAYPVLGYGTPLYTNYMPTDRIRINGWSGGGQFGYNYQFNSAWVGGIEADIQGSGMKDTETCLLACNTLLVLVNPPTSSFNARVNFSDISALNKVNWFGTLRGRYGYTGGTWGFIYATGGLAYGGVERGGSVAGTSTSTGGGFTYNTFAGSYDNKSVRIGWTLGAGFEGQLGGNWSLKAEYLFVDLGKVTDTFSTFYTTVNCGGCGTLGGQAGVRTDTSTFYEHVFRLGLNYKFGG